jgi:hypothetical protein
MPNGWTPNGVAKLADEEREALERRARQSDCVQLAHRACESLSVYQKGSTPHDAD